MGLGDWTDPIRTEVASKEKGVPPIFSPGRHCQVSPSSRTRSRYVTHQARPEPGAISPPHPSVRALFSSFSHDYILRHRCTSSTFAATILPISYGIEVTDEDDSYVRVVERGMELFSRAFVPGAFLVETFPVLRHVPRWLPGGGFKRTAAAWRAIAHHMRDAPFARTLEAIVSPQCSPRTCGAGVRSRGLNGVADTRAQRTGTAPPSIASVLMENAQGKEGAEFEEERTVARDVSALAYAGMS